MTKISLCLILSLSLGLIASGGYSLAQTPADAPTDDDGITTPATCAGGFSPEFRLAGQVNHRQTFNFKALSTHLSAKLNVAYFSGKQGLVSESYIGVPLLDLLNEAGVIVDPSRKNDKLRKYLVITATDCYQVVVALAELLPEVGAQQVIVAYADGNGQPLGADKGMARLVMPGDTSGGRYVSNISSVVVRSAPASR